MDSTPRTSDTSFYDSAYIPPYNPEIPKSSFKDILAGLAVFASVFFFCLFTISFSIETPFAFGYGRFLCLLAAFAVALFYVKRKRKSFNASSAFFALCALSVTVPYFSDGRNLLLALCLFVYFVSEMCLSESGSLTLKRDSYRYILEALSDLFVIPLKNIFLPLKSLLKPIKFKSNKKLGGILLGCVFAIPVIAVLANLLLSGDAAFSTVTSKLFDGLISIFEKLFDRFYDLFSEIIASAVFTLMFAPLIFSALFCFRHGIQKDIKRNSPAKRAAERKFVPENVATGFYVMICLLYVLYLLSQLSYFFGAFSGEIPLAVNMTLSEYARQGFFEMSAIAFINLALIAFGVLFVKRKESGRISPLFKSFFTFLCLFTMLMIVTAMSKMVLYITELGFTHKRILVCIIDILLFVSIVCVLIKLYKAKLPYMKIIVTVSCAMMSLYTLFGDSALIAYFNTNAYISGYNTQIDIETIHYETDKYHAIKSLRKIAEDDKDIMYLQAQHHIGDIIFNASAYLPEKKLETSTIKNFFTSESLTDFLFWEYVKDNKDFATKCLNLYRADIEWYGEY